MRSTSLHSPIQSRGAKCDRGRAENSYKKRFIAQNQSVLKAKKRRKKPTMFCHFSAHSHEKAWSLCANTQSPQKVARHTNTGRGHPAKMGDSIVHTGISPRDKGGPPSERKSMKFKHLDKTSARKEEKSGLEFEKLHTFAAQRDAKHTKTPPHPLHFP